MKIGLLCGNLLCGTILNPLPVNRITNQTKKILDWKLDIICLQEFNNFWIEWIYRKYLSKEYVFLLERIPFHIQLLKTIIFILINVLFHLFHCQFLSLFLFYPYFLLFYFGNQKTGNAILLHKSIQKPDNFNCIEFLNQKGDFLNWFRPRGFIQIIWKDKIMITNTHLNHTDFCNEIQMQEIINHHLNIQYPWFLVGDFNTESIFIILEHMEHLSKNIGFTFRYENDENIWRESSKQIDYIFFRPNKSKLDYDLQKKKFDSDHDALILFFDFI